MNTIMNYDIVPYEGIGCIKLGMKLEDIRMFLKENKISFDQWVDSNDGFDSEIPGICIRINKSVTLVFVKDILFEAYVENEFKGKLPNGAHIGMSMNQLEDMDPSLTYNDDDEDFISELGYWIEDEIESGTVVTISIFLPEVESSGDEFWTYKWLEKYL